MGRQPGLSDEEHWAKGIFPILHERTDKFPDGESLDDLRDRARHAVKEFIVPVVKNALKNGEENVHVAVVSHGLCISELVAAVVRLDYERRSKGLEVPDREYAGLSNTAWTRVTIGLAVSTDCDSLEVTDKQRTMQDVGETEVDENGLPALVIKVTDINHDEHLYRLVCFKTSYIE